MQEGNKAEMKDGREKRADSRKISGKYSHNLQVRLKFHNEGQFIAHVLSVIQYSFMLQLKHRCKRLKNDMIRYAACA